MNRNSRRQGGLQLWQQALDAIDHLDRVRAWLPLDIENDRGRLVHPSGLPNVFRVIYHRSHIGKLYWSIVPIRHDQSTILVTREQLIIGSDGESLAQTVETPFRLIHAGLHK